MPNKYITCTDCAKEFYFKETDQSFYAQQGFAEPKRCWTCRQKRKTRRAAREQQGAGNDPKPE